MRRDELRALQDPLKSRYRDDPASAQLTLTALGTLGEGITCSVAPGRASAVAGLHRSMGGEGSIVYSGNLLLDAIAACAGVTLCAVATSLEIAVAGAVHVEGDLDVRGTLAVTGDTPVGFSAIRVRFDLESDADEDLLDTLLRLTERFCVALQTLAVRPALSVERSA